LETADNKKELGDVPGPVFCKLDFSKNDGQSEWAIVKAIYGLLFLSDPKYTARCFKRLSVPNKVRPRF
jgi:hypothetical protein